MTKIRLEIDDKVEFEKEILAATPIPNPTPTPTPIPTPTPGMGTYSAQVKGAIKLDKKTQPEATSFGFWRRNDTGEGQMVNIPKGITTYFIIDPLAVVGKVSNLKVNFIDYLQRDNLSITVAIIDRDDNLAADDQGKPLWGNPYAIPLSSNTHGPWVLRMGHRDRYRYLITVTEKGEQAVSYNIYWARF